MQVQPIPAHESQRVVAGLPFVEALARRLAASMPHSIDIGDLVQDGVLGLIDAAHRFDEDRGIKFETFAERRVRGAMIDALRREAWPRGVRRQRRELEAARETLRRELGHEPSLADLAAKVGSDEKRLGRTILRINTIESTSPLSSGDHLDETSLPAALVPSEPESPDSAYERSEVQERIRTAMATLPERERRLVSLYYFGDVTMKQIGAELGVNESRVSQLHARAIQRLRTALEPKPARATGAMAPRPVITALTPRVPVSARPVLPFARPTMAKATLPPRLEAAHVLPYPSSSRADRSRSASLNGLASQRQPVSSRKRSASAPTTSPVTKMTRRASDGFVAAIAR
jgi:RNA polymerase sigma factor FliA